MTSRFSCLVLLLAAAPAWAQSSISITIRPPTPTEPALKYRLLPETEPSDANAAPLYYRAALLKGRDLSEENLQQVREWVKLPLDKLPREQVRGVVKRCEKSLDELALAVRREQCAWNVEMSDGTDFMAILLPELQPLRDLGHVLALKARLAIADGQAEEAVQALRIGFGMARHLGQAIYLIHGLVGNAIALQMAEQLRDWVQQPGAPSFYWPLAALPPQFLDMQRSRLIESSLPYRMFPILREVDGRPLSADRAQQVAKAFDQFIASIAAEWKADGAKDEEIARRLKAMRAAVTKVSPQARQFLLGQGRTAEQVDALPVPQAVAIYSLHQYQRLTDELLKWMPLPYWQAHAGLTQAAAQVHAAKKNLDGEPFPSTIAAFGKVRLSTARVERLLAALRCVEAIRLYAAGHGGKLPAALSEIAEVPVPPDPITGQAFAYQLAGNKATLTGPAPPGQESDERNRLQFELTVP